MAGVLLRVIYGSQTGHGAKYAALLHGAARRHRVVSELWDLRDCHDIDVSLAGAHNVVVLLSTYGDGEPSDSAKAWCTSVARCQKLMKSSGDARFAVFGLGDRTYSRFCSPAIDADRKLSQLGLRRIAEVGLGDMQGDQLGDFEQWALSVLQDVARAAGLDDGEIVTVHEGSVPSLTTVFGGCKPVACPFPLCSERVAPTVESPARVALLSKETLVDDGDRRVLDLGFSLPVGALYSPGDHLGVLPCNCETDVAEATELTGACDMLDVAVAITEKAGGEGVDQRWDLPGAEVRRSLLPVPGVSVRDVLRWNVDLSAQPRASTLRRFAPYVDEGHDEERKRLSGLTSKALDELRAESREARSTTVGVLRRHFPHCHVPFDDFVALMPRLLPRWYSIASSPTGSPHQAHVTVALEPQGCASALFSRMRIGDSAFACVRSSVFHLGRPSRPMVLIGSGTGIAPYVGFCQALAAQRSQGKPLGDIHCVFGCRTHEDFLHGAFFRRLHEEGLIAKLDVALSREPSRNSKVYVQHLMVGPLRTQMWGMLQRGAAFYICGDAKTVGLEARRAIVRLLQEEGSLGREAAVARLRAMQEDGSLLLDCWSPAQRPTPAPSNAQAP